MPSTPERKPRMYATLSAPSPTESVEDLQLFSGAPNFTRLSQRISQIPKTPFTDQGSSLTPTQNQEPVVEEASSSPLEPPDSSLYLQPVAYSTGNLPESPTSLYSLPNDSISSITGPNSAPENLVLPLRLKPAAPQRPDGFRITLREMLEQDRVIPETELPLSVQSPLHRPQLTSWPTAPSPFQQKRHFSMEFAQPMRQKSSRLHPPALTFATELDQRPASRFSVGSDDDSDVTPRDRRHSKHRDSFLSYFRKPLSARNKAAGTKRMPWSVRSSAEVAVSKDGTKKRKRIVSIASEKRSHLRQRIRLFSPHLTNKPSQARRTIISFLPVHEQRGSGPATPYPRDIPPFPVSGRIKDRFDEGTVQLRRGLVKARDKMIPPSDERRRASLKRSIVVVSAAEQPPKAESDTEIWV